MFIISKHTINIYDLYHYPLSFKSFTLQELESQLGEEWRVTLAERGAKIVLESHLVGKNDDKPDKPRDELCLRSTD